MKIPNTKDTYIIQNKDGKVFDTCRRLYTANYLKKRLEKMYIERLFIIRKKK